jgi:hypothetical protein
MQNVGINLPVNVIISSHFEPLSNFNATLDGNRNNPKLKSADFVEDGNVNQKTFRNKHSNEILKYSLLQHSLQNINILHSHPKEMLTHSIPKLINGQIRLGNKYEMEVTRDIALNGSGGKPSIEGYRIQLCQRTCGKSKRLSSQQVCSTVSCETEILHRRCGFNCD